MATFNIELWDKLKCDYVSGRVYFGQAPEDAPAPYCIIYVLDSGDDEDSRTLCSVDGVSDLQFTVYGFNDMQLDELLDQLNKLLKSYKNLANYRVKIAERKSTKNASSFSSEVGAGMSRFTFYYENS